MMFSNAVFSIAITSQMILSPRYLLIDVYIAYISRFLDLACLDFIKCMPNLLLLYSCFFSNLRLLSPRIQLFIVVYIAYIYRVLDCFLLIKNLLQCIYIYIYIQMRLLAFFSFLIKNLPNLLLLPPCCFTRLKFQLAFSLSP